MQDCKEMNSLLLSISDGRGCWIHVECGLSCPLSVLQRIVAPALNLEPSDWYFEDRQEARRYGTAGSCESADTLLGKFHVAEGDRFLFVQNSERAYTYLVRVKKILHTQVDVPRVVRTHGSSVPWPSSVIPVPWRLETVRDALAPFPFRFVERERRYLCAAANLYGLCPLPMVEAIMQSYEEEFDTKRFYEVAEILRHDDSLDCFLIGYDDLSARPISPSSIEDRIVVHEDIPLFDPDPGELIAALIDGQRRGEGCFHPSTREEFLKWSDPLYQEPTLLLANLRHTLKVKQEMYPEDIDEFIEQLAFMARTGHTPEETLSELCDTWALSFSDGKELDDFCGACIRWVCSIPQWYNGGFIVPMGPPLPSMEHATEGLSEFEQFRQWNAKKT